MLPNYCSPETLKRVVRFDLRARSVVEGFLSGLHRSRHFGHSIEFRQHRPYSPGDDPRHVDWKVWARQDRLYVKQYDVDTHLRLTLLADVSASMLYESTNKTNNINKLNKYDYAATLACSLAYLAIRQQDAVGCVTLDRDTTFLQHKTKPSQLTAIADTLLRHRREPNTCDTVNSTDSNTDSTDSVIGDAIRTAAETLPPFGLVVLISDLMFDPAELERGLRLLRSQRHDVIVLQVLDDDELDFPFSGATQFEGLDVPLRLRCDPRQLRRGYLDALAHHLATIRRLCGTHHADYALFRTSTPLEAPLATYLARRATVLKR